MATETLQYEQQTVEQAEKELHQAQENFNVQIESYKAMASAFLQEAGDYRMKRRFWLV